MTRVYPSAIAVVAALLIHGPASAQTTERPEAPAAKERAPGQPPGGNAQGNQEREPGKQPGKQDRGPDTKTRADTPEKGQKQSEPKGKRDPQQAQPGPTTTPKSDRAKDSARQSDTKGSDTKSNEPTKKQAQPNTKTDGQYGAEPGTKRADPKGTEPGGKRADPKAAEPGTKRVDPKGTDPAAKSAQPKGTAGDGQRIQVTEEQRTRVRDAFPREQLKRSTRVNISVSVGVSVPRNVELYAIPASVVTIAPAYRGYRYFVVDERICIVDPATYVVVDVIEVRSGGSTQTVALELTEAERAILLRHVEWDRARAEISVDLALGADIPDRVRIHEFPAAVRTEIPKLASYHYVVTGRDVVIVEPRSRDIVLVVRE